MVVRMVKVALDVSNVTSKESATTFIEELTNQYADLTVSNINISNNSITFDVSAPGMSDITSADIKMRVEEFVSMNVPPFNIKSIKVG